MSGGSIRNNGKRNGTGPFLGGEMEKSGDEEKERRGATCL
ncbi:hypothetical protein B8V81_2874 [Paenibacillus pasadenensis]|uniref:Uncharacterized protein n=1 Tax=Paenibacillus pasadenensis TaxID=217090 RepID=A0A2N5N293_9BACL|nr:hypothetical protein B8V81_2874 [Paenibacillus pasadenensis]